MTNPAARVFEVNSKGLDVRRGVRVAVVLLVPLLLLALLNQEAYWVSMTFGALFVGLIDPGGNYSFRIRDMAGFGIAGALLTVLAFAIGEGPWGFVVLVAGVITALSGLTVKFGKHRFVAGVLLNAWFLIALALPGSYSAAHISTPAWAQAVAWLIGSALMIGYTFIVWLAGGRTAQPEAVPEFPGDTSPIPLTAPIVLFAVIRAVAVSIAVAIAFGLHLPNADWMPIATLVAMKPSLKQSGLVAVQRLTGVSLGAVVAMLFLATVHDKFILEVIIAILCVAAASIRMLSYTLYVAAVTGAVLMAMDLPHPSNLAAEGERVLFTFIGVAIAYLVMLIANELQKARSTKSG